jgi:hypothetical protein
MLKLLEWGQFFYDVKILDHIVWFFHLFFLFHNAWSFGL